GHRAGRRVPRKIRRRHDGRGQARIRRLSRGAAALLMAPLFLCGLSGAGKSTVGALVAEALGAGFCDLDAEIEREAGRSVAEIFAQEGEATFRAREAVALERTLARGDAVIALGGGALVHEASRTRVLASGRVVWLDAPTAVLVGRLQAGGSAPRPLLA